jgi:dTDP-4-amino-4,6-dideoxygalactose transaminase
MKNSELVPLNDLSRWNVGDREKVGNSIQAVVDSGIYINGPKTTELKSRIQRFLKGREVVLVGNGTDALVVSLLGVGVRPGDHVATVANAGGYATGAILRIGAIPVLVDVDQRSAQMSVNDLQKQLEKISTIRAVVVTHLYGQMADMKAILETVSSSRCLIIEGCAQSIGAQSGDRLAGTFGDASTFSFYPTKNLSCLGDAGAISFKSDVHAEYARRLAQYGWSRRYEISQEGGINSRIDEIQAAVLVERLDGLEENNHRRRQVVQHYKSALNGSRYLIGEDDQSFVGHLAVMVTSSRDADISRLRDAQIGTGIHYPVLDHHQAGWNMHFTGVKLSNSEALVRKIVTIPCFPLLQELEIERVCEALQSL